MILLTLRWVPSILIKWWRKMKIYWSMKGAKWRFGNVREENEKGK
jgi:hypothetical protein